MVEIFAYIPSNYQMVSLKKKKKIPFGKTTRCGSVKVGGVKRGSALVGWELEHVYVGVY